MENALPSFVETFEAPPKKEKHEYELVHFRDPILRTPMEKFDFRDPPVSPIELYQVLGQELVEYNGVGLSACQLGLPYHAFVIRTDPIIAMFNVEIVDASEEKLEFEEGCLSFPELILKIKRPQVIRIRYTDPLGDRKTVKYQDFTARIIQHELDHCNGIPFANRVSRFQLERALSKTKKKGIDYLIGDVI